MTPSKERKLLILLLAARMRRARSGEEFGDAIAEFLEPLLDVADEARAVLDAGQDDPWGPADFPALRAALERLDQVTR